MTRIKRGFAAKKRRKKIIKLTKGFVGSHSKLFTTANQQNMKALRYSYNDRRKKKKNLKKLWIQRINATVQTLNVKYNNFIKRTKVFKININKKILSKICIVDNTMIYKILNLK